ncbi:MAG: hypothetical protein HY078_13840 [Elusimicrobia bacterium]|nr:hypothetical protein [Elusimicrobiota bacterium]
MNRLALAGALCLSWSLAAAEKPKSKGATGDAPKYVLKEMATPDVPEIPDKYSLPVSVSMRNGSAGSKETTFPQLRGLILTGTDAQKVDAAILWNEKFNEPMSPQAFWNVADQSLTLLDELFKQPPSPARRFSVFQVFAALGALVRDRVPFHPKEAAWKPHWTRLAEAKKRGLEDKDPRLAEFFQRYVPLPSAPDWKALKEKVRKADDKIAAATPAVKKDVDAIFKLSESIEGSQKSVAEQMSRDIRALKIDEKDKAALLRHVNHIYSYRMYTNWANMHPRAVQERVGKPAAEKAGLRAEPVKLGWPSEY